MPRKKKPAKGKKGRKGEGGSRHGPLVMTLQVIRQLEASHSAHSGSTLREIASVLGCHERTVRRKIDAIGEAGIPVQETGRGSERRYKIDAGLLPSTHIDFNVGEVVALVLARGFLAAMQGLPMAQDIESALEKARAAVPAQFASELAGFVDAVAANIQGQHAYAPFDTHFMNLMDAVCNRWPVGIDYRPRDRDKAETYLVHPHLVHCHAGTVYLVAWVPARKALRTFALDRIEVVRVEGDGDPEPFDRRPDFDAERFVAESFGSYHEGTIQKVVVRFDREVAPIIRERVWHPSQVLKDLPDGGVEVRFETAGPSGVLHWARAFLPHARVVAPASLAARQREQAKAWVTQLDGDS